MNNVSKPKIVVDFDGTITDVTKEAETFIVAFIETLSKKIGLLSTELTNLLIAGKEEIANRPGIYGWEDNGKIVAPATADPYILHKAAAKIAIRQLRGSELKNSLNLPDEADVNNFLLDIFSISYPKAGTFFREGAKEFLDEVMNYYQLYIVTNSDTSRVSKKLNILLGENNVKIIGYAKKYRIYDDWDEVANFHQPSGYPRPIYLRRKDYYDSLSMVGFPIDIVMGDIYELDLALPEVLGIKTILVTSEMTPKWEKEYYQNHTNGFSSPSLEQVKRFMEE